MNLIVQGPILSVGRGGKSAWLTNEQIEKEDIISFNCEENILKIIDVYSPSFDLIVISTWNNEFLTQYFIDKIKEYKNVILSLNTDIDIPKVKEFNYKSKLQSEAIVKNNKLKQFYLIYKALEFDSDNSKDWVKVRTDQFVDLKFVLDLKIEKNKVYVPKTYPRGFHDFYFIAKRDFMYKISYNYVFNHKELESNLHKDFPLNLAYNKSIFFRMLLKCRELIKNKKNKYFKYFSILTSFYIRHKIDQLFVELPTEMRKEIIWRGEKLKSF